MRYLRVLSIPLLAFLLILAPVSAAYAQPGGGSSLAVPITGTFTDALGGTGQFVGTFTLQRFDQQAGELVAIGTLVGTLTDSIGAIIGTVVRTISFLVDQGLIQATCTILHLELGPLDLDLLGLLVHLNRVVLDISAQPGPGNLLGNLLCAIANLLNSGGPLSALIAALNNLLSLL